MSIMENMPEVSVLMCIYNEPIEWITMSIDSILKQTFHDFEFIIINDNPGRAENTDLLNKYIFDKRILNITNDQNLGLTKSLNIGLKHCRGKYVARMDADDISLPGRLFDQVEILRKHPRIVVCGTFVQFIDERGGEKFTLTKQYEYDEYIKERMIINNTIAHPTAMIRRSVLVEENISYDEDYIVAQDYKLWFDLIEFGCFYNVPKKLLLYRVSSRQISKYRKSIQMKFSSTIRELVFKKTLGEQAYVFCQQIDIHNNDQITSLYKRNRFILNYLLIFDQEYGLKTLFLLLSNFFKFNFLLKDVLIVFGRFLGVR